MPGSSMSPVARFDVFQQLRWQDQAEEDIDREHEDEIRQVHAQRWPAAANPVFHDPFLSLRHAEKIDAEAEQPFRVGLVDDDIRHLPRVLQAFGLAPVRADFAHNRFRHRIEIDRCQCGCVQSSLEPFLGRLRSNFANCSRVGVSMPLSFASRIRNSS
jgi:hypothetical protein